MPSSSVQEGGLGQWLLEFHLSQFSSSLQSLGVRSAIDLLEITEEDLLEMKPPMNNMQRRRFLRMQDAIVAGGGGGGGGDPPVAASLKATVPPPPSMQQAEVPSAPTLAFNSSFNSPPPHTNTTTTAQHGDTADVEVGSSAINFNTQALQRQPSLSESKIQRAESLREDVDYAIFEELESARLAYGGRVLGIAQALRKRSSISLVASCAFPLLCIILAVAAGFSVDTGVEDMLPDDKGFSLLGRRHLMQVEGEPAQTAPLVGRATPQKSSGSVEQASLHDREEGANLLTR